MGISGATLAYISIASAAVGTAVSVYASVEQADQQKKAAEYNARTTENNAAYLEASSLEQAARIRKAGREQEAQAAAGLAGAGVKLGEGHGGRHQPEDRAEHRGRRLQRARQREACGRQRSRPVRASPDPG